VALVIALQPKTLRELLAYPVEEFGDFPIIYVTQQKIVGHQAGDRCVLPALLVGARVLRVALRELPEVL